MVDDAAEPPVESPKASELRLRRQRKRKRVLLFLSYYDVRHHTGVARYAAEAGWSLDDAYTQLRGLPESWSGDGVISFHGPNPPIIDYLSTLTAPVVDIGSYDGYSEFARVRTDAMAISRLVADHFVQRGYKSICYVWLSDTAVKQRRQAAMFQAARERGLEFQECSVKNLPELLARSTYPLGLVGMNDAVAVRVLGVCEDVGVLVPEQVAILGIDNDEYRCIPASVPLSSVDANQERVGYEAARLLDRLMNQDPQAPRVVDVQPTGIVLRDSTDMLAVNDLQAAMALRYIIQNFRSPIGLRDVARVTDISLRRLQTRFKENMGRTILQEINGRRVQHAQKLLAQTGLKIRAVAYECGFGSAIKMIRIFKQYTGASPKRFRKQLRKSENTGCSADPG